jgi:hypothetical protein
MSRRRMFSTATASNVASPDLHGRVIEEVLA